MYCLLQGGKTSLPTARNQDFFQKVAKLPSPILFVYFARYENEWEKKFAEDTARVQTLNTSIQCKLASSECNSFIEQLKHAPTVFIGGGSTAILKTKLEKIPSLANLLSNKFIVGTSAGACVLSTFYVNDQQEICTGLGIIPLKVFCHYNDTKEVILPELKMIGQKNPILLLQEGDFAELWV